MFKNQYNYVISNVCSTTARYIHKLKKKYFCLARLHYKPVQVINKKLPNHKPITTSDSFRDGIPKKEAD